MESAVGRVSQQVVGGTVATHIACRHKGPGILADGGPPESLFNECEGAMNTVMAGQLGRVPPLEDL